MPDFNTMQRRRLAARNQAMPDGGFPIRNVSDLKNAIQAYGRAKNKPAVKAWIKKRARELGATNLLPDNWRISDTLVHYGVKGMKWGVRKDPSKAYAKATKKADRIKRKTEKAMAKSAKYHKKADKQARRYAGFGWYSNKSLMKNTKRAARYDRKVRKSTKKAEKWDKAMSKAFMNVSVNDIDPEVLERGKNYIQVLKQRR